MIELAPLSRVAVADRLRRAASRKELAQAALDIQLVPSSVDRDHLARIHLSKYRELHNRVIKR